MNRRSLTILAGVGLLIAATCGAMSLTGRGNPDGGGRADVIPAGRGTVSLQGRLVQDKVVVGGAGTVDLELILAAGEMESISASGTTSADLVLVLDRSGSMSGDKIAAVRQATRELVSRMTATDRVALVTYSDGISVESNLVPVTRENRSLLHTAVSRITSGGGTNLGAGLQAGIRLITAAGETGNVKKLILISDGLANKGITDPNMLADLAAAATDRTVAVCTAGGGQDFNEQLMTRIADRGAGRYYYLDGPGHFAEVFEAELDRTRTVAASGMRIHVTLPPGVQLVEASGYPVTVKDGSAEIQTGDLLAGQVRSLYLKFKLPTDSERTVDLGGIYASFQRDNQPGVTRLDQTFRIACVTDRAEVTASIDPAAWEKKVLQDDFNRLKEELAQDIKNGRREAALGRITRYRADQSSVNTVMKSSRVAENLENDLDGLTSLVHETFAGAPQAVAEKKKKASKALQYDGYRERRAKQ